MVGKWNSGQLTRYRPLQRGFEFFYGFTNTGIDYFTHERYGWPSMWRGNDKIKEPGYATDLFEREGLRFLRERADEPFFLYMPFNAPHGASNFEKGGPQAKPEHLAMYGSHESPGSPEARYLGSITAMDEAIGALLAELERQGRLDNTLVVFFSDNGGSGCASNAPLRGKKSSMWEGGVRVVFAARWPKRIPAGSVTSEFLTSLELFPTFAKLAGAELPAGVSYDGFDMLPVLAGERKSQREQMVWERRNTRAVRYRNWKWVEAPDYGGLFDLSTDIGESRDLSQEKPELLRTMRQRFWDWKAEMQAAEPRGPFRDY